LRLNRDISTAIEDAGQGGAAGRSLQLHRYWWCSDPVLDLTGKEEHPLSLADGFDPVRHRLGITLKMSALVWRSVEARL
jgi:LPS-assembly protein